MTRKQEFVKVDEFALGYLRGHALHRHLSLSENYTDLLLRILPVDTKASPPALRLVIYGLITQEFSELVRSDGIDNVNFDSFSSALAKYFSNMYTYTDRTIFEFATAEWITKWHSRLTKQQIVMWGKDENPRTKRLSEIREKGAKSAMEEEWIILDEQHDTGRYAMYKLAPGIFPLLESGIRSHWTYNNTWDEENAKEYAREIIRITQFVTI